MLAQEAAARRAAVECECGKKPDCQLKGACAGNSRSGAPVAWTHVQYMVFAWESGGVSLS